MKKAKGIILRAGFFVLVICLPVSLSAIQYWGDGLFADFGYSSGVGLTIPIEGTIGIRQTIDENSTLFGAVAFNSFSTDITAFASAEPLTVGIFSLGVTMLSHLGLAHPIDGLKFTEYDQNVYLSAIFRGKDTVNPVKTTVSFGVNIKLSFFGLSDNNIVSLFEFFPALEVQVQKRFLTRHEFLFRFATYDNLRFKVFLNTWWQLGYSYDLTDRVTLAALFQVAYADQITNSGTPDGFQAKLAAVYKFKK